MDPDTVIPVAAELQKIAKANDESRIFVLVSSEKVDRFIMGGFTASTLDSEDYLFKECPNLKSASIRPGGFILDGKNRWWTWFLPYGTADFKSWLNMVLLK